MIYDSVFAFALKNPYFCSYDEIKFLEYFFMVADEHLGSEPALAKQNRFALSEAVEREYGRFR